MWRDRAFLFKIMIKYDTQEYDNGLPVHGQVVTIGLEAGVGRGVDTVGRLQGLQEHLLGWSLNRAEQALERLE